MSDHNPRQVSTLLDTTDCVAWMELSIPIKCGCEKCDETYPADKNGGSK